MQSVENILIGLGILIAGIIFLWFLVKWVFNRNGTMPNHGCGLKLTHFIQLILSILTFLLVLVSVHFMFGDDAVHSLITGFMIGGGLALQPLMKTVVNGFVTDQPGLTNTGVTVNIHGVSGNIKRVGMLHTWIETGDGKLAMISNDLLGSAPMIISGTHRY